MDVLDTAAQSEQDHASSSPESNAPVGDQAAEQAAITELEKLERFKFQGQDWTPKDLEKAFLRQKDYTQKTQSLAEDRKSLETERKFYENLAWDLDKVRANPQLANEFVKVYPEKFHAYLKEALSSTQAPSQSSQDNLRQTATPDVALLSRIANLEKSHEERQIATATSEINGSMQKCQQKYPKVKGEFFDNMILGRAYELHQNNVRLTDQVWDDLYKSIDRMRADMVKAEYGDMVKKQTEANTKARDVDSGGGTVGRAPQKFSFKQATENAIRDLTAKG